MPSDSIRSVHYERILNTRDLVDKFDTLEKGYDSLQIRIWYEYGGDYRHVLVIKNSGVWEAELHQIKYGLEDTASIRKRQFINLFPKMGWPNFIDSLSDFGILNLPDYSSIRGMETVHGWNALHVEVATNCSYRFSSYFSPFSLKEEFQEARKIEQILSFLREQLSFQQPEEI